MSDFHNTGIVDQFTRQAEAFAEKHRTHEAAFALATSVSGVTGSDIVLDVACGPGLISCAFARVARHVTGVDLTPAMLARAAKLQAEYGLSNLAWKLADVANLPYDDGTFSLIVTRYSFHHFEHPAHVLEEMIRVCSPGGTVCVIDATPRAEARACYNEFEKLRDPSHVHALTHDEFAAIFNRAGLRLDRHHQYWWEVPLEKQLAASFPANPNTDVPALRNMIEQDVGSDRIGMNAHLRDGAVWFGYPTTIFKCTRH